MFLSYQNHSSNRQLKLVLKTRNRVVYKGRISQLTVVLHSILADRHLKMCVGGYKFVKQRGAGSGELEFRCRVFVKLKLMCERCIPV
jgi:hypothetical protein